VNNLLIRRIKHEIHIGETVDIDKFSRRTVKVTPEHNNECKKLLSLMGIPYVEVVLSFFLFKLFKKFFINF
jgi:5'-3' exonuclease